MSKFNFFQGHSTFVLRVPCTMSLLISAQHAKNRVVKLGSLWCPQSTWNDTGTITLPVGTSIEVLSYNVHTSKDAAYVSDRYSIRIKIDGRNVSKVIGVFTVYTTINSLEKAELEPTN
jgi:hypothetical protein